MIKQPSFTFNHHKFNENDPFQVAYIFRRYYRAFVLNAMKFGLSVEDAEDIVGDVFARIIGISGKKFTKEYHVVATFYVSVRNASLNFLKQKKPLHYEGRELGELADDEIQTLIHNEELVVLVVKIISQFPEKKRKIFHMRFYQGMKLEQIALALDIKVSAVGEHIETGIKKIRKSLKSDPENLSWLILIAVLLENFLKNN
ncbi:MAG TPA: sigma-70 family RNA polymerase sigma factor [Puia sp.]|nr:sigma-70 family RNA polymerase sigma factor [Puia sp.]